MDLFKALELGSLKILREIREITQNNTTAYFYKMLVGSELQLLVYSDYALISRILISKRDSAVS
jgi:hypothetical protein